MNLKELGNQLLVTRKKYKLTQAELAKKAGISRATLSLIENGAVNEIGITKIIHLCELLSLELAIKDKPSRPTLQQLLVEKNSHD